MSKVKRSPRLLISFTPEQYELLQRLSELQEVSMAKIVRQLFDQVEPMFREVAVALEVARDAQGKPAARLISAMSALQQRVEHMTQAAVDQGDMFSGALARQTAKLKKRAVRPKEKAVRMRKRGRA